MFYVDYIEPGQPKKAPFVLRTDNQLSMFFKSESKSILLRVIKRIVQFEKGSVNILKEKDEKSCEVELSSMSTQSSASPNSKSSNDGISKESTRTVIPSHSRKRQKVTRNQDPKIHLVIVDDLLLYDDRILIPRSMRQQHAGHLGLTKCRSRPRTSVWRPGLSTQIGQLITRCHTWDQRPENHLCLLPSQPAPGRGL